MKRKEKEDEERKKEEERLRKEKEAEELEKKKAADDEFNFDDEFDEDFDDILDNSGKSKSPDPKQEKKTIPEPEKAQAKPEAKKPGLYDDEIEFDDDEFNADFDDVDDLIDSQQKKTDPKKDVPKSSQGKADPPKNPPSQTLLRIDNQLNHKKVFTSQNLELVDKYIGMVMPLSEEEVQNIMGSLGASPQVNQMLFSEFMGSKLIFMLDFEDTEPMLQECLDSMASSKINQESIEASGNVLKSVLQQTFEGEPITDIRYFFAPIQLVEEFENEFMVQAILDLPNKQVLFVSLNPEFTEENFRTEPSVKWMANVLAKVVNVALNGNSNIEIPEERIHLCKLDPELAGFLAESCEEPYLRYMIINYLILYENATNTHDFDGFKKSLSLDSYTSQHAARFISTINTMGNSLSIRAQLEKGPDLLEGMSQMVEMIMQKSNCQVLVNMADGLIPESELVAQVKEHMEGMIELKKTSERVFSVWEYCTTEDSKLLYFVLLQNDEPSIVLHVNSNPEVQNLKALGQIENSLKKAAMPYEVFFEHCRHQFMISNIDVFLYTWVIQVYETELSGLDSLRILVYNEVPFVTEIMQGTMEGEEEELDGHDQALIGLEGGEEDDGGESGGEGKDGDEFDDIIGDEFDDPKENVRAPNNGPKGGVPMANPKVQGGSKPVKIEKGDSGDFDFDDFDDDDQKPPTKKSDKKLNKPVVNQKKEANFDYGNEFDDFDDDLDKGGDPDNNFEDIDDFDF